MRKIFVVLFTGLLSLACGLLELGTEPLPTADGKWHCTPLPKTFHESDLVGTWEVTQESAISSDVIILREDGTYKQMYQKSSGERYESPWNRWWVEHRPSGGIHVHLEGMRLCHITDEVCESPYGGGGFRTFWDPCEYQRFRMIREVILAVVGENEPDSLYGAAPRGIILLHMRSGVGHVPGHWRLQE